MGTEEVCQGSFLGRGDLSLKWRVHFGGLENISKSDCKFSDQSTFWWFRKYLWFLFISAFKCSDCMTSKIWQPHWFCALLIKSYLVIWEIVVSCFLRQWFLIWITDPFESMRKATKHLPRKTHIIVIVVCNLIVLKLGICTGTSHLNTSICLWCVRCCSAHSAMRTQSWLVQYTAELCGCS